MSKQNQYPKSNTEPSNSEPMVSAEAQEVKHRLEALLDLLPAERGDGEYDESCLGYLADPVSDEPKMLVCVDRIKEDGNETAAVKIRTANLTTADGTDLDGTALTWNSTDGVTRYYRGRSDFTNGELTIIEEVGRDGTKRHKLFESGGSSTEDVRDLNKLLHPEDFDETAVRRMNGEIWTESIKLTDKEGLFETSDDSLGTVYLETVPADEGEIHALTSIDPYDEDESVDDDAFRTAFDAQHKLRLRGPEDILVNLSLSDTRSGQQTTFRLHLNGSLTKTIEKFEPRDRSGLIEHSVIETVSGRQELVDILAKVGALQATAATF